MTTISCFEDQKDETLFKLSEPDEKEQAIGTSTLASIDSTDVDEALELVGTQRTLKFSEEYGLRVRKKLVCGIHFFSKMYTSNTF